jgi:hypothetical protein
MYLIFKKLTESPSHFIKRVGAHELLVTKYVITTVRLQGTIIYKITYDIVLSHRTTVNPDMLSSILILLTCIVSCILGQTVRLAGDSSGCLHAGLRLISTNTKSAKQWQKVEEAWELMVRQSRTSFLSFKLHEAC